MRDLELLKQALMEKGVEEREFNDIVKFFELGESFIYKENEWGINFIQDAEGWISDTITKLKEDYTSYGTGDFIQFILSEYVPDDMEKVITEFAKFLSNTDDAYMVYCPSTQRCIFFEA